jgi:hypothetical protein
MDVFSAWSVPKVYKRYGTSLVAVEFRRTKRIRIQRSTTEYNTENENRVSYLKEIATGI